MKKEINFNKLEVRDGEIKKKRTKHSHEEALTPNQLKELYLAVEKNAPDNKKEKVRALFMIMAETGLRISEALEFRREWWNPIEGIISIPSSDKDIYNLKSYWRPKSENGQREIHLSLLNPKIVPWIDSFITRNPRGLQLSNKLKSGSRTAQRWTEKYGTLISKPDLHPHALRSTFANNLVALGVNANTLKYYMGWSKLETAENYIKSSPEQAKSNLEFQLKLKELVQSGKISL